MNIVKMCQAFLFVVASFVVLSVITNYAFADGRDLIDFHTFGTLAGTTTSQPTVGFLRDAGQTGGAMKGGNPLVTDSRVGAQIDVHISPKLSATIQGTYAKRAMEDVNSNLQWLYLKYIVNNNLYVRVGRVGADLFAVTDQQNVGYTYPWIRPPVEVYGFMPIYSMDGIDLTITHDIGDGIFTFKPYFMRAKPDYFLHDQGLPALATTINFSPVTGFTTGWKDDKWTVRFSAVNTIDRAPLAGLNTILTQAQAFAPYDPRFGTLGSEALFQNTWTQFYDANVTYDDGNWFFMSEATRTMYQSLAKPNKEAGYVTAGKYFMVNGRPLLLYGTASEVRPTRLEYTLNPPATSPAIVQGIASMIMNDYFDKTQENQRTLSVGAKYTINEHFDLKAEYDRVKVFGAAYAVWDTYNGVVPNPNGVNVYAVAVDWIY